MRMRLAVSYINNQKFNFLVRVRQERARENWRLSYIGSMEACGASGAGSIPASLLSNFEKI